MLSLSLMPNERSHNRYGFIVSKQVGGAVTRNRIRRQLSEAVRLLHPRLRPGYDLVWIARRPVVGKPYDEIARIVHDLCRQTGLLVK
jgi:ribonuclease P protein component